MDIYKFFYSDDIAGHCKRIGHVFNPLEMAVIVAYSKKPIKEKHAAWREIIKDYPDMPCNRSGIRSDSLHKALAKRIEYEESVLARFKKPESNTFYKYKIYSDDCGRWSETTFQCYEEALTATKSFRERDEPNKIQIEKVFTDIVKDHQPIIVVMFDYNGDIKAWDFHGGLTAHQRLFPCAYIEPDVDAFYLAGSLPL